MPWSECSGGITQLDGENSWWMMCRRQFQHRTWLPKRNRSQRERRRRSAGAAKVQHIKILFNSRSKPACTGQTFKARSLTLVWKLCILRFGFCTFESAHQKVETKALQSSASVGLSIIMWVCLKMLCTPLYPMVLLIIIPIKWLFHWEYTQHFQTNPCLFPHPLSVCKQPSAGPYREQTSLCLVHEFRFTQVSGVRVHRQGIGPRVFLVCRTQLLLEAKQRPKIHQTAMCGLCLRTLMSSSSRGAFHPLSELSPLHTVEVVPRDAHPPEAEELAGLEKAGRRADGPTVLRSRSDVFHWKNHKQSDDLY